MGAFIGFSTVETTISRGACARSKLTFAPRNSIHSQHTRAGPGGVGRRALRYIPDPSLKRQIPGGAPPPKNGCF